MRLAEKERKGSECVSVFCTHYLSFSDSENARERETCVTQRLVFAQVPRLEQQERSAHPPKLDMTDQQSLTSSGDSENMVDAATYAFWQTREQLRECEAKCSALRRECLALRCEQRAVRCAEKDAEDEAREELLHGAVRARNCALGLLQESEDSDTQKKLERGRVEGRGFGVCLLAHSLKKRGQGG